MNDKSIYSTSTEHGEEGGAPTRRREPQEDAEPEDDAEPEEEEI